MDYTLVGDIVGIFCLIACISSLIYLYRHQKYLQLKLDKADHEIKYLQIEIDGRDKLLNKRNSEIFDLNEKLKKPKSKEILEILNDLNRGDTLLSISRIDQNDVYFHNSGK